MRFGVQAQYRKLFMNTPVNPQGIFDFNGRATGAANYRSPTVALFADDVWRLNDRLTLQLGVRWEYLAPWQERDYRAGSVDPVSGRIGYHKVPANIPAAFAPL